MRTRIDELLVKWGLMRSRHQAQEALSLGLVKVGERIIEKPSHRFEDSPHVKNQIQITDHPLLRFVSRGGVKLEGALKHLKLSVQDFSVLDIGVSTGGFSDCCLQNGAARVVGVDVGHAQINPALLKQDRFKQFEGLNAALPDFAQKLSREVPLGFDLVVADVSFVSLTHIIANIGSSKPPMFSEKGLFLGLVKPQFELDRSALNKSGVVKDSSLFEIVETKLRSSLAAQNMAVEPFGFFASTLEGTDGNQEFFIFAKK